ncbi:MAG: pyridoxal phosphate-dependent aminotransferase [Clostridia bacterium]
MKEFSKRATMVAPSLTLAITAQANKLKSEGVDVVGFTAGEPDFNTPEYINNAAREAIDKGFTKYTPASGTMELKKAICAKLLKDNGLTYSPQQIVVSGGAKQSIYNALQILVEDGDEVIIISPYWLTYPELVKVNGGKPVVVDALATNGFKVLPKDIEKVITSKTKAVIFNSPNNPTGAVYNRSEIEALMEVFIKYDLWIISDEIYEKLVYNGATHVSVASINAEAYKRTFVVNGMSKAYAMTGWRIGYIAAPNAESAKYMGALQSHQTSNPNSIAQYASVTALNGGEDIIAEMVNRFAIRRNLMLNELKTVKYVTAVEGEGAFYVMVDVTKLFGKNIKGTVANTALEMAAVLLDKCGVAVIPCESFGADGYIRLSYTLSDCDIVKGIGRMRDLFNDVL